MRLLLLPEQDMGGMRLGIVVSCCMEVSTKAERCCL